MCRPIESLQWVGIKPITFSSFAICDSNAINQLNELRPTNWKPNFEADSDLNGTQLNSESSLLSANNNMDLYHNNAIKYDPAANVFNDMANNGKTEEPFDVWTTPLRSGNSTKPILKVDDDNSQILDRFDNSDAILYDLWNDEQQVHMRSDFDSTEISILCSFIMDSPGPKNLSDLSEMQKTRKHIYNSVDISEGQKTGKQIYNSVEKSSDLFVDNAENESVMQNDILTTDTPEKLQNNSVAIVDAVYPLETVDHLEGKTSEKKNRRLCKHSGCLKRCRSNGLCISHGGGRRCAVAGCGKSSQGGNLCIRHGGGKRCSVKGCMKAAQSKFLCKAHGGGPRCQFKGCSRSSQGGGFCRCHGGGRRCSFIGCNKGTQRGYYCALHGGSRLCRYPGCVRNDRGGGLCATHGGGKRCHYEECEKPCRRKGLCSAHLR